MFKLIRDEWRLLLFGFLMTFWSSPGQTFFISLFSGEIRLELDMSNGEFGAVYSLATLCSAIVIIWSGSLLDRTDLKHFSLAIVLGLAVGCLFVSMSVGVISLFVAFFLMRQFGQGLMFITSTTAVVRYIQASRGKSTALAGMGYAVSEAIMPSLVVALILWAGWRHSWQIIAIMLVVFMVIAILLLLRNHQARHANYIALLNESSVGNDNSSRQQQWTRNEVLRDRLFYLFVPGLLSQPLMFTGFIFHQVHLTESRGWSLSAWASLFLVYALVSVATKFVGGYLVDRFGAIRMVACIGLPMALGLFLLSISSSFFWGGVFLVLTGFTVGFQSVVSAPFWAEMYGSKHLGAIKSLGTSLMVFCTAVSPVLFGYLIDLSIHINTLAMASSVYMLTTSAMAWYACRLKFSERGRI